MRRNETDMGIGVEEIKQEVKKKEIERMRVSGRERGVFSRIKNGFLNAVIEESVISDGSDEESEEETTEEQEKKGVGENEKKMILN